MYPPHRGMDVLGDRQKELPRVTHESLRRKNQGHSPLENQGRRQANGAIPTFTALFRLHSYQELQEITYPLLQHYLKQTPSFINPSISGLQESFPLGALGKTFGLQNFGDNALVFISPFSGRMCKPGGLKHWVHVHLTLWLLPSSKNLSQCSAAAQDPSPDLWSGMQGQCCCLITDTGQRGLTHLWEIFGKEMPWEQPWELLQQTGSRAENLLVQSVTTSHCRQELHVLYTIRRLSQCPLSASKCSLYHH